LSRMFDIPYLLSIWTPPSGVLYPTPQGRQKPGR
jgi:hypothetical protein